MIIRIRIFIMLVVKLFQAAILKKPSGVFYKSCSLCKGIVHTKIKSHEDQATGIYDAIFQCNKCGAIGTLHEEWKK